ncbi:TRAP transporter substrate-binding protein [Pusillimonas sp. ANT_WB101]|uniref:TRAP transporter substrate-binding protein n=1 Tax=Pusillimonas sp. ANT_WB101 TaxID=2597356 RepID=UPI0011F0096F|nr:TRAP transporter substrate-binding protein [Pusillimonas sp. ANT_WB101]KAA0890906.1 TRAP transporter substrate-binding protein [Pusillimonas sp. ANT_WB101]
MRLYKSLFVGLVMSTTAAVAHAETWEMATPYPESNFHTKNVLQFTKDIDQATDGKLKIKVHAAGSLIKHPEIKNSIRSRQIQIGEFFVSILANEDPIFALDSVPFVAVSFDDAFKLYQASKPTLEEKLGKQGLKILYSVAWPPQGLYSDREINKIDDLRGLKFRVYNPQLARMAQLVGAVSAQVEVPDLAQAFTTGRVNTMLTATSTGVDSKAWDYLKYFYDVKAYLPKNVVAVNQKAFDSLEPSAQKAVLDAAAAAEKRGWKMAEADHLAKRNVLEEHGIKVSDGSENLNVGLQKVGVQMAEEWSKSAGETGAAILKDYRSR